MPKAFRPSIYPERVNSTSLFSMRWSHLTCNAFWVSVTSLQLILSSFDLFSSFTHPVTRQYPHTTNGSIASCYPHCLFFPTQLPTESLPVLQEAVHRVETSARKVSWCFQTLYGQLQYFLTFHLALCCQTRVCFIWGLHPVFPKGANSATLTHLAFQWLCKKRFKPNTPSPISILDCICGVQLL